MQMILAQSEKKDKINRKRRTVTGEKFLMLF